MDTPFSDAVSDTIIPPNPTDGEYNDEIIDNPELLTQSIEALHYTFENALEDADGLAHLVMTMRNTPVNDRTQVSYEAYLLAAQAYTRRQGIPLTTVSVECYAVRPDDTWNVSLESIADAWRRMIAYLKEMVTRIINRVRAWFSNPTWIKTQQRELRALRDVLRDRIYNMGKVEVSDPALFAYCQLDDGSLSVLRAAKAYEDMATFVFDTLAKPVNRFARDYANAVSSWMDNPDTMADLSRFDTLTPPPIPSLQALEGTDGKQIATWCHCPAVTVTVLENPPEHRLSVMDRSSVQLKDLYQHPSYADVRDAVTSMINVLGSIIGAKMVVYDSLQLEGTVEKLLARLSQMKPGDDSQALLTLAQPLMASVQDYAAFNGIMAIQLNRAVTALTSILNVTLSDAKASYD